MRKHITTILPAVAGITGLFFNIPSVPVLAIIGLTLYAFYKQKDISNLESQIEILKDKNTKMQNTNERITEVNQKLAVENYELVTKVKRDSEPKMQEGGSKPSGVGESTKPTKVAKVKKTK